MYRFVYTFGFYLGFFFQRPKKKPSS